MSGGKDNRDMKGRRGPEPLESTCAARQPLRWILISRVSRVACMPLSGSPLSVTGNLPGSLQIKEDGLRCHTGEPEPGRSRTRTSP